MRKNKKSSPIRKSAKPADQPTVLNAMIKEIAMQSSMNAKTIQGALNDLRRSVLLEKLGEHKADETPKLGDGEFAAQAAWHKEHGSMLGYTRREDVAKASLVETPKSDSDRMLDRIERLAFENGKLTEKNAYLNVQSVMKDKEPIGSFLGAGEAFTS